MKKQLPQFILATLFLSFSSLSLAHSIDALTPLRQYVLAKHHIKSADLLFVQTSQGGVLEVVNSQSGKYKLTLTQVNPEISYFANRPVHLAGFISASKLYQFWNKGGSNLKNSPPNAMLVTMHAYDKSLQSHGYAFALSQPIYNAQNNEVTYMAQLLKGSEKPPVKSTILNFTALFIDDVSLHFAANESGF